MDSTMPGDDRITPLPVMRGIRRRWKYACLAIIAIAILVTCVAHSLVSSNRSSDHPTVSDLAESWQGARYVILEVYEEDSQGLDSSALWSGASEGHLAGGVLVRRCILFDRRTIVRTSRMLEKFRYGRQYVSWAPSRIIRIYLVGGHDSVGKGTRIEMLHIDELPEMIVRCDGRSCEFHCDDPKAREWVKELYLIAQNAVQLPLSCSTPNQTVAR